MKNIAIEQYNKQHRNLDEFFKESSKVSKEAINSLNKIKPLGNDFIIWTCPDLKINK